MLHGEDMNFNDMLAPVPASAKFVDEDFFIWGGSVVKDSDGVCHMLYSRWPRELGHNAWVTHSEIAHAVSDSPLGPFKHVDVALPARGPDFWDGHCTHNPTVHEFEGKYYLYYMGNKGDGNARRGLNWTHRNNQRVGVAVADHPNGPWKRYDKPLIDVGADDDAHDALLVNNPSIARRSDGVYVLVYKCVAKKSKLPFGGPVAHMVATSQSPAGPFKKHPDPVFTVEGAKFPAEDPYIWAQDGEFWAIVKDMRGTFTKSGRSLALFSSKDGINWELATNPLVSKLLINWEDADVQRVSHLERPQLLLENGKPTVLYCAADTNRSHSFNVHIPLRKSTVKPEESKKDSSE